MGLLSLGTPLKWEDAKKYSHHVREHGVQQFINTYHRLKDRRNDNLKWGDEVEYILTSWDHDKKTCMLSLRGEEVINILNQHKKSHPDDGFANWNPEYAKYMIEGIPSTPYGHSAKELLSVEQNMKRRRKLAERFLNSNELLISLTSFPILGTLDTSTPFVDPYYPPNGPTAMSKFVPDQLITSHPRFSTLTANIRTRRGSKVFISSPIFQDINTLPDPSGEALPGHIHMDAMVFGMGCCCLQITFQACSIHESRRLYDQLAPLAPIAMALTAASPIHRGYLLDTDCRWNIIADSVDDRNVEERTRIHKSRYGSIDCYIGDDSAQYRDEYNDIPIAHDLALYQSLINNDIDHLLALHISHLFIRDPLAIYTELLDQDDTQSTDHFENINSTNWQSLRFKPPPPNSSIGWRVEFRSMEVQLTDFENAAFCIFIVLITRAILSFNLNFYIPISKVDENMKNAQKRDAILSEKFYFRKNIFASNSMHDLGFMTMDELINGSNGSFPGLIPIILSYLDTLHLDIETRYSLSRYLQLIQKRASGELPTMASWLRSQVRNHPKYKQDSIVSNDIHYDIMCKCRDIMNSDSIHKPLLGGL